MAALDDHPNCFRYEGRLWVSERPREEALAALVEQRRWDAATVKQERWWIAIVAGAALGIAATLALGFLTGIPPVTYLFTLPFGFAAGAVVGAVINRRIVGDATVPAESRPVIDPPLTRVPFLVARRAPVDSSTKEIIEWSKRGFFG